MGIIWQSKEKNDVPPKIDQKYHFPSNRNPLCYFSSGKGLIDLKFVSLDIKLILKAFEISKIWVKPFFLRPPS